MPQSFEINFDGLVGPTHNYAGLSYGNLASQKHARTTSHPKAAALQGLAKMKLLHDLGVTQAVLPPQRRPHFATLRKLGFTGTDTEILQKVNHQDPRLLVAAYSSSSMWAANAATVSPSADTADHRVHFTPANLLTQIHRSIETTDTAAILRAIFPTDAFVHHDALPAALAFADEGAANHMRLWDNPAEPGIEIFVYGRSASTSEQSPKIFPARQTLDASDAIARLHRLDSRRTLFVRQNPDAIDAGAFHNDVVAVSNQNVLLIHGSALMDQPRVIEEIKSAFNAAFGKPPLILSADPNELTLETAVQSYIFNSQLVTLPDGSMSLIAPVECQNHSAVQRFLHRVQNEAPVSSIHYKDVRQSMNNGGGPACLRLRITVTEEQLHQVHPGVMFNEQLHSKLLDWIEKHYRESLHPHDLGDSKLAQESNAAMDELGNLLGVNLP